MDCRGRFGKVEIEGDVRTLGKMMEVIRTSRSEAETTPGRD